MIEKGRPKIAYIAFLAMTEPLKDRRRVVKCFYQLDFGNGKFFAGLEKYIPGNAGISQTFSQSFRYFLASAVRSS
jgi:hypothetical protein